MLPNVGFHDNTAQQHSVQVIVGYMGAQEGISSCFAYRRPFGNLLRQAWPLSQGLLKGRASELRQVEEMLRQGGGISHPPEVILRGLGGVGKTQLAIEYAKRHPTTCHSVFFLNAESEASLKTSFRCMANIIFPKNDSAFRDNQQLFDRINGWLCDPQNLHWLLIFDGYDDPDQFDIKAFYPWASHGSIIITTQRYQHAPEVINVQPIKSIEDGTAILQARSGRPFSSSDPGVMNLVNRFKGLPLGFATAGECLRGSSITPEQVLQGFNDPVETKKYQHVKLYDYPGRTLYTSWDRSYNHLKKNHPSCAKLLKLLANFNHQELWYELFRVGVRTEHPEALQRMMKNVLRFDHAMKTLEHYSFVEIRPNMRSWTMHPCVRDWILTKHSNKADLAPLQYAFGCITKSLTSDHWQALGCPCYSNLAAHAACLVHQFCNKGDLVYEIVSGQHIGAWKVAILLYRQKLWNEAKTFLEIALRVVKNRPYSDETSILVTMHSLGKVSTKLGNLQEAEQMFLGARKMGERHLGSHHLFTISAVQGLEEVYRMQGRLRESEQVLQLFKGRIKPEVDPYSLLVESKARRLTNHPARTVNRKRQSRRRGPSLLEGTCLLQ